MDIISEKLNLVKNNQKAVIPTEEIKSLVWEIGNTINDIATKQTIVEPTIELAGNRYKAFQSAYGYIMEVYKPNRNIKPCIAYVLVNGIKDGWRNNAIAVAYECLRVYNFNKDKAWNLLQLYYENSYKKKRRNLAHLRYAMNWVLEHKNFKVSCSVLSSNLPCIGSKEACYKLRGIGTRKKNYKEQNQQLLNNQRLLLYDRVNGKKYFKKLSPRAYQLYILLLNRYFKAGFDMLFISYRELAKGIGDYYQHIEGYLKQLKKAGLIYYKPGKPGLGSKIATEIKILDITGRKENNAERLFKKMLFK